MLKETNSRQLQDDPELFELMLSDLNAAPEMFHPTNYWQKYFQKTIDVLRGHGLASFRSRDQGYFISFGAADLRPGTFHQKLHMDRNGFTESDKETVYQFLDLTLRNPDAPILPLAMCRSDLDEMAIYVTQLYAHACSAKSPFEIGADLVGDPLHSFCTHGKTYTHSFLDYYMRYCAVAKHIDFTKVDNIVEIGSGAGNQVEILRKLYPHIKFYLVDLSPYLYVAHQFLSTLFPGHVVNYRETRGKKKVTTEKPGSIVCLGNWQLDSVRPEGRTLFWNCASFGEMEPNIVEYYLDKVKVWSDGVFLHQAMKGKELGTKGKGGVLEKVTFDHYARFLGNGYSLIERDTAYRPLNRDRASGGYEDTIWVRNIPQSRQLLRDGTGS